jgi:hypothetical protein
MPQYFQNFNKCCIFPSIPREKVKGALWPSMTVDNKDTTNHPGYMLVSGTTVKLYVLKLRAIITDKTWLLSADTV